MGISASIPMFLELENHENFGEMLKRHMTLERARIEGILSPEDTARLMRMAAIYVNSQGKLLAYSDEDDTLCIVETVGNGFIPRHAMFVAPYACLTRIVRVKSRDYQLIKSGWWEDDRVRGELSAELSNYIWPLDQDAIHAQFTLPCHSFFRSKFFHTLKVVFGNRGGGADGEFFLATCNDGRVKFHVPSRCCNGNNVWTIHLFDDPCGGEVHFSQRLRRIGSKFHNGHVINNHIGGNFNGSGGTQNIGPVNL